jgi:hypothetical protein
MSTSAKSKTKMALAGIAALALGSSALIVPAAAQRVPNYRSSHSLSVAPPMVPAGPAGYGALATVVGVGY